MGQPIKTITIEGFKSIRKLDAFPLGPLNVLIGANGAGKSNFVDFLRLVRAMADESLSKYTTRQYGLDGLFHLGPKMTPLIRAEVCFRDVDYAFKLEPFGYGAVAGEAVRWTGDNERLGGWTQINKDDRGSKLKWLADRGAAAGPIWEVASTVYNAVRNWSVYHFHDTSHLSPMRRDQAAYDDERLREDGSNIAPFLQRLRDDHPRVYESIRFVVGMAVPAFSDFRFRVNRGSHQVRLEWDQRGTDFPFQPWHLSDGSIRFVCLATALLQPDPPATIVFDEPELGLHPHALGLLGEMIRSASVGTQVIVSTQSASLLNDFDPDEVVVVTSRDGSSEFRRLGTDELTIFLEDFSLGALWEKNYIDGAANG